MPYRILTATIVLFWLTMTGLLVRKELVPGATALRAVPVAHVAKLMFAHEQASDLQIYQEKLSVGRMQIHPHFRKDEGQRRIDLTGSLQLMLPGMPRQRVTWTGGLELDNRLELERLTLGLSSRAISSDSVEFVIEPAAHRLTFESRAGDRSIRRVYSLDEKGVEAWLRDQGIDSGMVMSLHNPRSAPLLIKAQQSSLAIRGEKVETYLVSAEQGEQTMFEAHISQLGQILRVRTFVGFSAAPDDLVP